MDEVKAGANLMARLTGLRLTRCPHCGSYHTGRDPLCWECENPTQAHQEYEDALNVTPGIDPATGVPEDGAEWFYRDVEGGV